MSSQHVVKKGESLAAIAHRYRINVNRLWNANTVLHNERPSPDHLRQGDTLEIPSLVPLSKTLNTDAWHTLECPRQSCEINLRLQSHGIAREGLAWKVKVPGGRIFRGTTDGEGRIRVQVPLETVYVRVEVTSETGRIERYRLEVGLLDPIDTLCGVQQRLRNLSIPCPNSDALDDETIAAIQTFENRMGLDVIHGDPENTDFLDALKKAHGS